MNNTEQSPIDKMRSIVKWADNQSEYINELFKSIKAIEQAYDYCTLHEIPFIDNDYIFSGELTADEQASLLKIRKTWLK